MSQWQGEMYEKDVKARKSWIRQPSKAFKSDMKNMRKKRKENNLEAKDRFRRASREKGFEKKRSHQQLLLDPQYSIPDSYSHKDEDMEDV